MNVTIEPGPVAGSARIPGSKSHTIRSLLIAGMSDGVTTIREPLDSEDTQACMRILRQLGVTIQEKSVDDRLVELRVSGSGTLTPPKADLDCANSGTTLYLALSMAALQDFPITFTGDEQLQRRSARPLLDALCELGATVEYHATAGCVPLTITGPISGGSVTIECPVSQYLSSLLLAAPLTSEGMEIDVPLLNEKPYVGITLSWLDRQRVKYECLNWERFVVPGGHSYRGSDNIIPADFSSGTFFLIAPLLTGSDLEVHGLDMADSQGDKAVVEMLRELGAIIDESGDSLRVRGSASVISGGRLDLNATPDALPALAILGTIARGTVTLGNVPQARLKETDRITVMASIISSLGGRAEELADGLVVHPGGLGGGTVDSFGDHRIAMAMAIAGLAGSEPLTITNAGVAGITFPGFFDVLHSIGARITAD